MAIQLSTGLRNAMLDTGSVKATLDSGFIKIYGGTVPASADDAESGTLLCTVSVNSTGTGITFAAAAASGAIQKNSGEIWSGVNAQAGVATHYRHIGGADTGASSTTEPRIQGTIGLAGADMNLSNVNLSSAATQTIDYYVVNMPAA